MLGVLLVSGVKFRLGRRSWPSRCSAGRVLCRDYAGVPVFLLNVLSAATASVVSTESSGAGTVSAQEETM
jgi:hypothetical protein